MPPIARSGVIEFHPVSQLILNLPLPRALPSTPCVPCSACALLTRLLVTQAAKKDAAARKLQDAHRKQAVRAKAAAKAKAEAVRAAKAAKDKKLKGLIAAAKKKADSSVAKVQAAAKRKIDAINATADAAAEASHAERLARARARARAVETHAKLSQSRLRLMQEAKAEVKLLKAQVEELYELQQEAPESPSEPTPKRARRDEKGHFAALDWRMRELIYGQEARRTPPSAIAANITDVLHLFASEEVVPLPCVREMKRMRGELTVAGECLAAFRVALAKRIISFGFDESTKFGLGLLSSNTQIEPHDAPGTCVLSWLALRASAHFACIFTAGVAPRAQFRGRRHARRVAHRGRHVGGGGQVGRREDLLARAPPPRRVEG